MTHPFHAVHKAVLKTLSSTLSSLRQQAPGARMIGEFAVKHVAKRARERVTPMAKSPSDAHNDSPQS